MRRWLLGLLGGLMAAHLLFLGVGAFECKQRQQPGEICLTLAERLQVAVDGYIAVILALMAKPRL